MGDMYDDERNSADDLADTGRDAINSVKNAKDMADKFKDLSSSAKKGADAVSGAAKTASSVSGNAAASTAAASAGATAGGAAASGGAVAAGAAAGGVGAVIVLAAMAAKKIASTDISSDGEGGTSLLGFIIVGLTILLSIILIVLAPAIVIIYVATMLLKPIGGIASEGLVGYTVSSIESYMEQKDMERYFERIFGAEWHQEAAMTREFSAETVEVCKDIVDYSIQKAYDKYVWEILFNLGNYKQMLFDGYNPYETYKKFLSARHPYSTKQIYADGGWRYITVQDYIDNYDKPGYENDDLNYAEFFTVLCQNEKFNYNNFSYEEFFKTVCDKRTTKLLFELRVENENFYKYTAGGKEVLKQKKAEGIETKNIDGYVSGQKLSEAELNAEYEKLEKAESAKDEKEKRTPLEVLKSLGDSFVKGVTEITDAIVRFFDRWSKNFFFDYDVTLKPYGLEELYKIADVVPDAPNKSCETLRNIDMLDTQEALLRGVLIDSDLGPAYNEVRSRLSCVYDDLAAMVSVARKGVDYNIYGDPLVNYPTGRSAMCYMTDSLVSLYEYGPQYEQLWMSFPESTIELDLEWAVEPEALDRSTVVLNIPKYVWQLHPDLSGIPRGDSGTFGDYGCIDSCYYMIDNYYWMGAVLGGPTDPHTMVSHVTENSKCAAIDEDGDYYTPEGYGYIGKNSETGKYDQFLWWNYTRDIGAGTDSDVIPHYFGIADDAYLGPFYVNMVKTFIAAGIPVVLHIKDVWSYNGMTLHGTINNHFLLIMGYDPTGFYVMDPGNINISDVYEHDESHVIPYEAFEGASDKWIRAIEPISGSYDFSGMYLINTIRDEEGNE